MTPIGNAGTTPLEKENYVWRNGVIGPKKIAIGEKLPKGITCANIVKTAWALMPPRHAKRDDVVFCQPSLRPCLGRPPVSDALGCSSTPIPV